MKTTALILFSSLSFIGKSFSNNNKNLNQLSASSTITFKDYFVLPAKKIIHYYAISDSAEFHALLVEQKASVLSPNYLMEWTKKQQYVSPGYYRPAMLSKIYKLADGTFLLDQSATNKVVGYIIFKELEDIPIYLNYLLFLDLGEEDAKKLMIECVVFGSENIRSFLKSTDLQLLHGALTPYEPHIFRSENGQVVEVTFTFEEDSIAMHDEIIQGISGNQFMPYNNELETYKGLSIYESMDMAERMEIFDFSDEDDYYGKARRQKVFINEQKTMEVDVLNKDDAQNLVQANMPGNTNSLTTTGYLVLKDSKVIVRKFPDVYFVFQDEVAFQNWKSNGRKEAVQDYNVLVGELLLDIQKGRKAGLPFKWELAKDKSLSWNFEQLDLKLNEYSLTNISSTNILLQFVKR